MLKRINCYVLSIISIYMSYLICRIFDFKIIGKIVIYILNFAISICLVLKLKKNTDLSNMKKKENIIFLFIAGIVSIIVVLSCNFFTKDYVTSNTEIYSDYPININIIESVIYNNSEYIVEEDGLAYEETGKINDKIHISVIDQNRISISMDNTFKSAIKLREYYNNLYYQDNGNVKNVENRLIYVESNAIKNETYYIRFILSFLSLTYIIYMLILYVIQNRKDAVFICTIISIGLIGIGYFINVKLGKLTNDSYEYKDFNFSYFLNGNFDSRTPGYPFVIRLCTKLFGEANMLITVSITQYLIWFISIIYMYKLLKLITNNNKICCVICILYALCPGVVGWNNLILTESIALSLTCIFIYHIVNYIKKSELSSGLYSVIIAVISTFIRPTSLICVAFLEIFFIARFIFERENIRRDIKCFIASTISIVIIVVYAIIFHRTFGIYSISSVMVRQDLYVCIQQGYYKNSNNVKFIEDVEEGKRKYPDIPWKAMEDVLNKYSLSDMKRITNYCRKQNMEKFVKYILQLAKDHTMVPFDSYNFEFVYKDNSQMYEEAMKRTFSFITFLHVYGAIAINGVLVIYKWIIDKKVPWIYFGLFGFLSAIVITSFVGTCAEWMRTAQCVLPFTYISLAVYISFMTKEKEVNYDRVIEEK